VKVLYRIVGVGVLTSRWIIRQPLWMVQSLIWVVGFILIMAAWGGVEAIKNIAIVFMLISFWTIGLNIVAQDLGWSKVSKRDEMFIASPLTLTEYYLGIIFGAMIYIGVFLVPSAILLYYLGILHLFPLLFLLGIISLFLGSFVGMIAVLRIRNPTNISAITNPLVTLTNVIPPVYYPAYILPPSIGKISALVPTATVMEIARYYSGIPTVLTPIEAAVNLALWFLASLIILSKLITWGRE
jgi:ABC-2 type transport system permease protein